jgi:hypothetical protein
MKKLLLILGVLGAIVLAVVLVAAIWGWHMIGKLNTPEFKATLLQRAKEATGTNVDVHSLDISLTSGVTMKGVRVDNPPPFTGPFLTADAFVLRYRLRPLLSGRFEVQQLSLDKPVVSLAMDSKGGFNYDRLGAAAPKTATPVPATPASGGGSLPFKLVLSKLSVSHADVGMTDATKATLLKVHDANFDSSFEIEGAAARGHGDASINSISMADMLFLRDVKAKLDVTPDVVKLAPLNSKLAGGDAGGDLTLKMKNGFRYTMNLDVKNADVKTLASEAKSAGGVEGKLAAKATFEGTGGMETMKGKGKAEITSCKVSNSKVLSMLSTLLRVPELASPDFKQCLVEFQMNGNRVDTPVISFKGAITEITGHGTMNMASGALDYQLNLALSNALLGKMPAPEMRAAFKDRGDGFGATDFKVFGTTAAPQNDLAGRVGKAAATEVAKKGIQKLFGGKKLF